MTLPQKRENALYAVLVPSTLKSCGGVTPHPEREIMAKRHHVRRRGYVVIPFSQNITLTTLASELVLSAGAITFGEDIFILSVDATWAIRDMDGGQGPIIVGLSHGDLSDVEIQEALEAELSDPDDIIAKERARRPVRTAGSIASPQTDVFEGTLAHGEVVRTRCKFSIGDGHTLDVWARNRSGAALSGGMVVAVDGLLYGRWQR